MTHLFPPTAKFRAIVKQSVKVLITSAIVSSLSMAQEAMNELLDNIKFADGNHVTHDIKYSWQDLNVTPYRQSMPHAVNLRVLAVESDSVRSHRAPYRIEGIVERVDRPAI